MNEKNSTEEQHIGTDDEKVLVVKSNIKAGGFFPGAPGMPSLPSFPGLPTLPGVGIIDIAN